LIKYLEEVYGLDDLREMNKEKFKLSEIKKSAL
jgi:hypothetical protein